MIRLAILGSTGSVGQQALDVVRALPDHFRVVALGAGARTGLLRDQVAEFRPLVAWARPGFEADALARELGPGRWQPLDEMATRPDVDVVLVATSGIAGLAPTLAALEAGKPVALANKEVLAVGGPIVCAALQTNARRGAELRPVDSEHSAIGSASGASAPSR